MANEQNKPGTGNASPEQPKIKFTTPEEMERFEKMIGKRYIRKNYPEEAKDFYFQVTGAHPDQPAVALCNEDQFNLVFEVQKYFRNKFVNVSKRDDKANQIDLKVNLQVDSHVMKNGKWILADPMASFFKDARQFKEEFSIDTTE